MQSARPNAADQQRPHLGGMPECQRELARAGGLALQDEARVLEGSDEPARGSGAPFVLDDLDYEPGSPDMHIDAHV